MQVCRRREHCPALPQEGGGSPVSARLHHHDENDDEDDDDDDDDVCLFALTTQLAVSGSRPSLQVMLRLRPKQFNIDKFINS